MPSFHLQHVTLELPCGRTLFSELNWHHHHHRSALIGRNGVGKSLLAQLIVGQFPASSGVVRCANRVGYFAQTQALATSTQTVAQLLAVDKVLYALEQVASGSIDPQWFDVIDERWLLQDELKALLAELNLPDNLNLHISQLSGGQQARLALWRLFNEFNQTEALLVLDEPSNHLDQIGKTWLLKHMQCFKGAILLISHDRQLLAHTEHIYELDNRGLHHYAGNFASYQQQKQLEQHAVSRQLLHTKRAQQALARNAQQSKEKAQQRAQHGQKESRQGSQPKVLQDFKRNNAGAQLARGAKLADNRQQSLLKDEISLKARQALEIKNTLYMKAPEAGKNTKALLRIEQCQLPFGTTNLIDMYVKSGQKWLVCGHNGAGKSTLFSVIQGQATVFQGAIFCNGLVMCLDQHASLLDAHLSLFAQCQLSCPHIDESQIRTLLAGIGFRGQAVQQKVGTLSGGQKMKLAMLIVSQQSRQPLLLLDEPDNHLDLAAKQQLAELLYSYQGTFLLISHDEEFVKTCAVTHVLQL